MKIISWNMGRGFDTGGYRKQHQAALDWVREQKPDVALLQEVQLARLACFEGMAMHCVPTSTGATTGNAIVTTASVRSRSITRRQRLPGGPYARVPAGSKVQRGQGNGLRR